MKNLIIILIIIFLCYLSCFATSDTNPISGLWLSQNKDAIIEIFSRNDLFFGKIVWLEEPLNEMGNPKKDIENPDPALRNRQIWGLEILQNFEQKKNKWKGGSIYDPESGKTYSCTMKLKGNYLYIRGFIGISLLGRTEVWSRTELESTKP